MLCLLPSRPLLPALLPGEQLVPRDAGRLLPVSVPVCPAALLAVCVSWDTGPGKQTDRQTISSCVMLLILQNEWCHETLPGLRYTAGACCVEVLGA